MNKFYDLFRPKTFSDVYFQESIVKYLNSVIINDELFNVYLFYGDSGIGKTSLARVFAKTLNCLNRINKDGFLINCNNCKCCQLINNKNHSDYIEIDAASNRGIDNIKNLINSLSYNPIFLKYKILILDECHSLTNEASNALLKTLEEPITNRIIILITTNIEKMITTLLSRCQILNFRNVKSENIKKFILKLCSRYNIDINEDLLQGLIFKSKGNLRNAINFFEIFYNFNLNKNHNNKDIDLYKVLSVLPISIFQKMHKAIISCDINYIKTYTKYLIELGFDLKKFWFDFVLFLSNEIINNDINKDFFLCSNVISSFFMLYEINLQTNLSSETFNNLILINIFKFF